MNEPWEAESGLGDIRRRLNRLFDQVNRASALEPTWEQPAFVPPVDILEDEAAITIFAELPGVQRDDVEVHVEQNQLFLRGEKRPDTSRPANSHRRTERTYGRFARTFQLPRTIDVQGIQAHMRDGVLELRLPKSEGEIPRRIQVS